MFGKKTVTPQVDVPDTVIGRGITLEAALLTGKESVRVDGVFLGDVNLGGSLILGETGTIEGNVRGKYVIVAGHVKGNIECEGILHISSTARVYGDIKAASIIVDEGGQLSGRYQVGEASTMIGMDKQPLLTEGVDSSQSSEKSYLDKSLEIVDKRDI